MTGATGYEQRIERPRRGQEADPHAEPSARPLDGPSGSTASHPGEAGDAAAEEHTRATVIPGEGERPRLDFADLAAVRAWLEDLAVHVHDLGDAAEDQIARK